MKEEKGREWNETEKRGEGEKGRKKKEEEKGRKAEIIKLQMNILIGKEDIERDREDREKDNVILTSGS